MTLYYQDNYGDNSLTLEIETQELDISEETSVSSARRLDLRTYSDSGWSNFTVTGTVTVPDDIESVFPVDEWPAPDAKLVLAVDFPDTHHRYGKDLDDAPLDTGSFPFEVTFGRDVGYGTVTLTPYVMLADDLSVSTPLYATYAGQRVADGRSARILFDDLGQDRGGMMNVEFKPFSETSVPDENLYHLDRTSGDLPEVWINEDHKLVADVLDSGGNSGFRPFLRKSLAPWIAMDIKVQLVEWAIIGARDGDFDEPWQERILDDFGEPLYDATSADNPADLNELYRGELGDDPHFLLNEIEKTIQQDAEIAAPLTKFIEREGPDYLDYGGN